LGNVAEQKFDDIFSLTDRRTDGRTDTGRRLSISSIASCIRNLFPHRSGISW